MAKFEVSNVKHTTGGEVPETGSQAALRRITASSAALYSFFRSPVSLSVFVAGIGLGAFYLLRR
jgi:hypothetical protein